MDSTQHVASASNHNPILQQKLAKVQTSAADTDKKNAYLSQVNRMVQSAFDSLCTSSDTFAELQGNLTQDMQSLVKEKKVIKVLTEVVLLDDVTVAKATTAVKELQGKKERLAQALAKRKKLLEQLIEARKKREALVVQAQNNTADLEQIVDQASRLPVQDK
jgi:SOS response regulatory protein OraA/RecX